MHSRFLICSRTLLIAGAIAGLTLAVTPLRAQDPPGAARLAHIEGNVSFQPNGTDGWGQAASNMPVGPGDRVFTDGQGRGELEAVQIRAYFSPNADLTLVNINGQGVELGLAQGSIWGYGDNFAPGQAVFISTPSGGVTIPGKSNFRIDVFPDQQSEIVTNVTGAAIEVNEAGGFDLRITAGQSVQLSGANPVYSQPLGPAPVDDLQRWAANIDTHRFTSVSARYVSAELPGYDQLDAAGEWQPQSDYGPIWFPRVEAGWAPYHFGHWVNMPFYGWTWVADEPWGAAPFHYGRWVTVGGRWGWIPGPREGHPVWSPAQVVFAGGIQVGGVGVSAWFPLGPGEAYKPWYPCSPTYINQINITNIHESSTIHVQVNYVNIVNVTNVTYVNRTSVVAMNTTDFAAGKATKTAIVKVDPHQVEHIQVARPEAKAPAAPVIMHPVSKPAAAPAARPVLVNHTGQQVAAVPNAKPVPVPVKQTAPPKPIPGHTPVGAPSVGGKPAPAAEPAKAATPDKPAPQDKTPAKTNPPASTAKPGTPPAKTPADNTAKPDDKTARPDDKTPPAKDGKKPGDKKKDDKNKKPEDDKKPQ